MEDNKLSKCEADKRGFYSKPDLKSLFRLKPAEGQAVAAWVSNGYSYHAVYDKNACVPMWPYVAPSDAQKEALGMGRKLLGTAECSVCEKRFYKERTFDSVCDACLDLKRKNDCAKIAQQWMSGDYLILDTETTGLNADDEVIELSIINMRGETVFDSLFKPTKAIEEAACNVHGLTDDSVANAPTFAQAYAQLCKILSGKKLLAYNESFDRRLLNQTAQKNHVLLPNVEFECVMNWFACWNGEPNSNTARQGKYRSIGLNKALQIVDIDYKPQHRAKSDCIATLLLIESIANQSSK